MPYFEAIKAGISENHKIYGFHVDGTESDPSQAVSYHVQYNGNNVDNYSYNPAYMDFANDVFISGDWNLQNDFIIPRPCMLKYDGTVDYYLNPHDYTKKYGDMTASDVSDLSYAGNAMMEWGRNGKKIWYKVVPDTDPTSYTVYISDTQMDEDFHCWSFYDANDNQIDHFYTRIYNCYINDGKARSISGYKPTVNINSDTMVSAAKANNSGNDVEWHFTNFADYCLINLLHVLISKSLNGQAAFGQSNLGPTLGDYNVNNIYTNGLGDTKGMFYGTNTNGILKTFGMEYWWGNVFEWAIGAMLVDNVFKYKLTYGTADGSLQTGYVEAGSTSPTGYLTGPGMTTVTANTYISKETALDKGIIVPIESGISGSSDATYYCDGRWANNGIRALMFGGGIGSGNWIGPFAFHIANPLSVGHNSMGFGISCRPIKTV